ncbi:hypothetical protein FUA23_05955 [Neolewinella aurantiaca]|uniref:Uncharacterized protein n=1 Tax=Neolewinella aurantiaca TaxID=2602767 RepID=A0A5C7FHP8_9BACT|nr:hypothetical protein [Neolewinella aurantiaca]TXF90637.1 hypothetical protein FUA23_05955 [Neolewinella aurantiaca]
MNKLLWSPVVACFGVLLAFFSCSADQAPATDSAETDMIDAPAISVSLKGSKETLFSIGLKDNKPVIADDDKSEILRYANLKAGTKANEIFKTVVDRNGAGVVKNIIFYLKNTTEDVNSPFAIVVKPQDDTSAKEGAGEKLSIVFNHACTGGACGFMKDEKGNITGCKCDDAPWETNDCADENEPKCNHFVST